MESSLRGDGDEATKGVDSFLDPSNMSLASFEPSLQIYPPTEAIYSPSPSNNRLEVPVSESHESRTPPLTVADLTAPAKKHTDEEPDSSPLARQVSGRPAAPI